MEIISCECELCRVARSQKFSEYEFHLFVGMHRANHKVTLKSFEENLQFASVTHWDVGYCDKARYYIYRDDRFNAIAWYDVERLS